MKKAGYIQLVLGFLWIGYDVTMDFTRSQYMTWIVYVKTKLPEGDSISRQKASSLIKEMGLKLRDRHRLVIFPAVMMLAGGLMVGRTPKKNWRELGDNSTLELSIKQ